MSEYSEYLAALYSSHRIKTRVKLYDADENFLGVLDHQLSSGQVDIDITSDKERSCSLTFADVPPKILFHNEQQRDVAIFSDNMISIEYVVVVESINKEVVVPIFFGPVTRFERDGTEVTVEAMSKDALLQDPVVWGRYLKNSGLTSITTDVKVAANMIRQVLADTGETASNMYFSNFDNIKLPKGTKLPTHDGIWAYIQGVVRAANAVHNGDALFRAFYDGRGKLRVENRNQGGYNFTDHDATGTILNQPQISFDLSNFANTVVVNVNRQDGITRHVVSTLPNTHPLSAKQMGRNGVPRYIVSQEDNGNFKKLGLAQNYADKLLDKLSTETVQVGFDSLPIPHLHPGSRCTVTTNDIPRQVFYADQFSIPLRAGDVMSIGYTKRMATGPSKPTHIHWITQAKHRRHQGSKA